MLGKIWSKLRGSEKDEALLEHRRFHRVTVDESALVEVEFEDGSKMPVRDISFGGLSLPRTKPIEDNSNVNLRVLDLSYATTLAGTHNSGEGGGYQFADANQGVLVFLQPIMDALHQGASLRKIDSALLKEETSNRYAFVLRGEGPTDILIETSDDPCLNCLLTLRKEKVYRQVSWRDGIVATARMLDERGVTPRMNADRDLDPETLRQALLILAGGLSQEELIKPLKPLLTSLQARFESLNSRAS